jgi:hypothetical protein
MPTSCKPEAVIDSELFVHWNPLFPPSPQIVRRCCISDSVDSVEQPCDVPEALNDYEDARVNWNSDSIIDAIEGTDSPFENPAAA